MLNWDELINWPVYAWSSAEKEKHFSEQMTMLNKWHYDQCTPYQHWVDVNNGKHLPIWARQFKQMRLSSIASEEEFKTVTSSGTSGNAVSQIILDRQTSSLQSKVLTKILGHWLGKKRLPYLVVDSPSILSKGSSFGARAAGVQGLSFFGRDRTFALDDEFELDLNALQHFLQGHSGPILVFGFTFIVWSKFLKPLLEKGFKSNNANIVFLHSGGWKKMLNEAVDNAVLKRHIFDLFGTRKVHNFYGMAEQTGSIYVECSEGHLHVPVWANIEILDTQTFKPVGVKTEGLIQTQSLIPSSYPGHNIATEDIGVIRGIDDCKCGLPGKYFNVLGRVPASEVRGCSDTFE